MIKHLLESFRIQFVEEIHSHGFFVNCRKSSSNTGLNLGIITNFERGNVLPVTLSQCAISSHLFPFVKANHGFLYPVYVSQVSTPNKVPQHDTILIDVCLYVLFLFFHFALRSSRHSLPKKSPDHLFILFQLPDLLLSARKCISLAVGNECS